MLQHRFPSIWPSRFARFILFLSGLLFAWAVVKVIFAPHKGAPIPYWLAFDDYVPLYLLFILWGGICALFLIRFVWTYRISWLVLSIICALLASFVLVESDAWQHIDAVQFNGQTFHLAQSRDDRGWASYLLCQCDESSIICRCRSVYATTPPLPANLAIDPTAEKLSVMLRGSTYHWNDLVIYTLNSSGNHWCLNENLCTPLSGE